MKAINLLLLAPHWRVSLIRAFQSAKTRLGVSGKLVGADSDPLAASLKVADAGYSLPLFEDSACRTKLIDICKREAIHAILPMTNKAIEFLNRHRKDFNRDNLLAYLQDSGTIEVCHDKQKLAQFFESEGIPCPVTGSAEMFAEMLKLNGYKVIKILNSVQAIKEIIDKKPDAILLDLMMPEVSGLDILHNLKKNPELDNIPTIVISAKGLPVNIESGFKAGASEYLVKPVTFQSLKKTLEKHLTSSSKG